MKYIPGHLHEKLQEEHYYLMLNDITISIMNEGKRYNDISEIDDYDHLTYTQDFFKDDIICVRFYKTREDGYSYSYIEYINNKEVKRESTLSRELILSNEKFFKNITFAFKRDKLIDSILC